jgi:hypothetical protein
MSRSPILSTVPVTPDTSVNLSKDQATIKKSTVAGLSRHQLLGSSLTDGSPGPSSQSKLPQRSTHSNLHVPPTHSRPSSTISEADREYFCSPTICYSPYPQDRSMVGGAEKEKLKQREREWNRPTTPNRSPAHVHERVRKPSTPGSDSARESPHSLTARNLELHHRRTSSRNSLLSHSPASSIASFEQERDREVEHIRERNWNSPQPKWDLSRGTLSPTPSSISGRQRTLSHPTRPSLGSRPRYGSTTSSSPSRAASPAFSHSSKASVEEEIDYERERNWNSPHSHWSKRNAPGALRPGSPSLQQGSSKQTSIRQRAQSLTNTSNPRSDSPKLIRSKLGRSPLSQIPSPPKPPPKKPPTELQLPHSQPDIMVSPSTPPRPSVTAKSNPQLSPPKQPEFSSEWKFPTKTISDTESEPEPRDKGESIVPTASPERPPLHSRIPVRASTSAVKLDDASGPREAGTTRHRRSFSEFHQANGTIPPRVSVQTLLPPHDLDPEDALRSA